MEIGVIGLGKMGLAMALNLKDHGYKVKGYDQSLMKGDKEEALGIEVMDSLKDLTRSLKDRKVIFLSLPSGDVIDRVLNEMVLDLNPGDVIVECGNSHYKDTKRRFELLLTKHIHLLDCGMSGGPRGARDGACTMIGGDVKVYNELKEIFDKISVDGGSLYTGEAGSGHYVKMVHNGIEYGMMQAIAEGFEIMKHSRYDLDLYEISKLFDNGSVIRSWLMELTSDALSKDENLDHVEGIVHASGEGKWTVEEALNLDLPAPIIALSLMMRQRSTQKDTFSGKLLASLRNEFGGHDYVAKDIHV